MKPKDDVATGMDYLEYAYNAIGTQARSLEGIGACPQCGSTTHTEHEAKYPNDLDQANNWIDRLRGEYYRERGYRVKLERQLAMDRQVVEKVQLWANARGGEKHDLLILLISELRDWNRTKTDVY